MSCSPVKRGKVDALAKEPRAQIELGFLLGPLKACHPCAPGNSFSLPSCCLQRRLCFRRKDDCAVREEGGGALMAWRKIKLLHQPGALADAR